MAKKVKKLDVGALDDVAEQAKRGRIATALPVAKNNKTLITLGKVGTFMLVEHINDKPGSLGSAAEDPGNADEESRVLQAAEESDISRLEESEGGALQSNGVVLGMLAVGIGSMAF